MKIEGLMEIDGESTVVVFHGAHTAGGSALCMTTWFDGAPQF